MLSTVTEKPISDLIIEDPVTGDMELNMGPQHPSTHGVIRLVLLTDGEVVTKIIPDVGYLHRSIEKISEMVSYHSFTPYTDRVDYLAAMHANAGYAMAAERIAGIEVPERAEYIRVIAQEFNRIISHFIALGTYAMDMGAFTPFMVLIREREYVNDLMEALCGSRLTYNFIKIGGVNKDLPDNFKERSLEYLKHLDLVIDEYDRLISNNKIFVERLANIGVISQEQAKFYGLVGPNLRASGIKRDIRKDRPYSVYNRFEFEVPVGKGFKGQIGDSFDRYYVRALEVRESIKILRQAFAQIPDGEIRAKVPKKLRPPAGETISHVEAPRGDMMHYLISDATDQPYRLKIRTGSFNAMTLLEDLSPGMYIADLVSFFASLDVVAPEIDR
jgi:NADH-quinone oxidoreductase subunit D